jgi:ParB family chromosome partitioning protein
LHEALADDGMTLEQLMAFFVTLDWGRQDQVWDNVNRSHLDEAYWIRDLQKRRTPFSVSCGHCQRNVRF